ncbi:MAG: DUF1999 family protein [Trueperaceae bacterium]
MSPLVRPLSTDDVDALQPLDGNYARRNGCEEIVDDSSLSFYARSGHAFVLERSGEVRGFLLGQAVWDGRRPTLLVRRVVASDQVEREALLEAVTKSAFDAGVYDLLVELPDADSACESALASCGYAPRGSRLFGRVLGTRSRLDAKTAE